jgi:hypothetical protein
MTPILTADILATWQGSDAELARHLGVTRQAVRYARLTHGVPAPLDGRRGSRPWLSKTLCAAVNREAHRRVGAFADDAARLEAILGVLAELNVWARQSTKTETARATE